MARIGTAVISCVVVLLVSFAANATNFHKETTRRTRPSHSGHLRRVVVATCQIFPDELITSDEIRVESTTKVTSSDPAVSLDTVAGQLAVIFIQKGQQIAVGDLHPSVVDLGSTLGAHKGMRAVMIALDPVSSIAGYIRPGDKVDVLCVLAAHNRSFTHTVLTGVRLLATGGKPLIADHPEPKPSLGNASPMKHTYFPYATVEVKAEGLRKLIRASKSGPFVIEVRSL